MTTKQNIAVQINLFPTDSGLLVVPFSKYDALNREAVEIERFVIPWHDLQGIIERMEGIEIGKLDVDSGNAAF